MQSVSIGDIPCDFIAPHHFYQLCEKWLASNAFHHVVTLNAEMIVEARHNATFRRAAQAATMRVPEGGPLWAHSYLSGQIALLPSLLAFAKQESPRVTGIDILPRIVGLAHKARLSTYLLGGTPAQVRSSVRVLRQLYPNIRLHTSPEHAFDATGPRAILEDIAAKKPALLLVAYGAPKQTLWIEEHRQSLPSVRIAIGIGGAFAMLGGAIPRAPAPLRRHNLEWAWRLWQEPRRLPRIWRATVQFPLLIRHQKRLTRSRSPQ